MNYSYDAQLTCGATNVVIILTDDSSTCGATGLPPPAWYASRTIGSYVEPIRLDFLDLFDLMRYWFSFTQRKVREVRASVYQVIPKCALLCKWNK